MVMKGGGERSANPNIERMLNIFYLRFSAREEKAVSRICASKTRRNLRAFGWCLQFKQSCPWASLSYFCRQKTSREINAVGRVILRKNFSEKLSIINPLWRRRKPLQFEFTNIAAKKTTTSFVKTGLKRGAGEKEKSVTTSIMQKYSSRGGWYVKWDGRGGGGGGQRWLLCIVFTWAKWYVSDMTICVTH